MVAKSLLHLPKPCGGVLEFEGFDGRHVVAAFDGGAVTSDAGAVLLCETDRAIGLIGRVAACFSDGRDPGQLIHALPTLVGQRIVAIALGYEDVNDHDRLRFDPVLALFGDSLEAERKDCAPLAGKSTMNRLEHAPGAAATAITRSAAIARRGRTCSSTCSSMRTARRRGRSCSISTPPTIPCTATRKAGSSTATTTAGVICRSMCSAGSCWAKLRRSNIDAAAGAKDEVARLVARIRRRWPEVRILLAPTPAAPARS